MNSRELLDHLAEKPMYQNIRTLANPAVDKAGVAITNLKHTANRAKAERFYLDVHSKLPI